MDNQTLIGLPVCSIATMRKMEKNAFSKGLLSEKELMNNAGVQIAIIAEDFLVKNRLEPFVYLLVGKGNNGGDAFVAGKILLAKGFSVVGYFVGKSLEDVSSLNKENRELFLEKGGVLLELDEKNLKETFEKKGLIIDGLLGTGFSGKKLSSLFQQVIFEANTSRCKILSIDVPSGIGSDMSEENQPVNADVTVCLALAKTELFLEKGFSCAGKILCVDIGFSHDDIAGIEKPDFMLLDEESVFSLLPKIKRVRHKYSAGSVIGIAGSCGMEGAAKLASLAALRAGAGIVKLFTTPDMDMRDAPYELVKLNRHKERSHILETINTSKALFIGPGLGREETEEGLFLDLLPQISVPVVLDADALYYLSLHPSLALPKNSVLTPHRKEMQRLLALEFMPEEKELFSLCQKYVDEKKCSLLLKGAPTILFEPKRIPIIIPRGDPGLATAGTGDVLTGIIAALLSQGLTCFEAALLGAYLHAVSGEIAAVEKTSYSLIASDIISCLPEAIKTHL